MKRTINITLAAMLALTKDAEYIGTGVTMTGGRVYCYMAIGASNWINAYT